VAVLHLIGLGRLPVFVAGGVIAASLYMRGMWWLLEQRAAAIDAVEL
jgi:hypothetical protein